MCSYSGNRFSFLLSVQVVPASNSVLEFLVPASVPDFLASKTGRFPVLAYYEESDPAGLLCWT